MNTAVSAKEPWLADYIKDQQWHSLLEIGGRHGIHTHMLSQRCRQITVLEPDVTAGIWQGPWRTVTLAEDLFDHLTPGRRYDCIVCLGVMPHLHSPFRALDQMARASDHIIIDYSIVNLRGVNVRWQRGDQSDLVNCTVSLPGDMIQRYLTHLGYTASHSLAAESWTRNCTLPHRGEVWQKIA